MPDETGAKMVITDESAGEPDAIKPATALVEELDEAAGRAGKGGGQELNFERPREHAEGDPIESAGAEPIEAATHAAPGAVADALHAAAEQIKRDRSADAGDQAALAEALRTFVDTLAGQNGPTRSEFRDLAARLDRLSSQYAKGR